MIGEDICKGPAKVNDVRLYFSKESDRYYAGNDYYVLMSISKNDYGRSKKTAIVQCLK